jgi:hypothetical protein
VVFSVDRITNDPTAEHVRLVLYPWHEDVVLRFTPCASKTGRLSSDSSGEISEDLHIGMMMSIWASILNREPTTDKIY